MDPKPKKLILSDGREIEYFIDRSRRRNIYISVKDGKVVLKLPLIGGEERGEAFVRDKADWIFKNLRSKPSAAKIPAYFCEGEKFTLAGEEYTICCEEAPKYFYPQFEDGKLTVAVFRDFAVNGIDKDSYTDAQTRKAIEKRTVEIVNEAFDRLTKLTGLSPRKVTIRKMTASWGRCSSNGSISINSNVVFYPKEFIDYVIIHELCHLVHMDHSADFWELVSHYCPDWKRIRKNMR
jgi:predicted metal-dependent hydrolase